MFKTSSLLIASIMALAAAPATAADMAPAHGKTTATTQTSTSVSVTPAPLTKIGSDGKVAVYEPVVKKIDQGYSNITTYDAPKFETKPPKGWRFGYRNKNRAGMNE